jgi:hypothetical protein
VTQTFKLVEFWPSRINFLTFFDLASKAILNGLPFSMIRLGDGEGAIMALGHDGINEHVDACFACWFGDQVIVESDRLMINQLLLESILSSDVIGIPRYAQLAKSIRYQKVFECFPPLNQEFSPFFVDAAYHFYLQWSKALAYLIRIARRVIIIGPRDVAGQLASVTNAPILQWLVKGEAAFPGQVTQQHWSIGFYDITDLIRFHVAPGDLVLVGAGILGKYYVSAARSKGCVALDIGSVIDGWDNVFSRPGRIDNSPQFGIDFLVRSSGLDEDPASFLHSMMSRLIECVSSSGIPDPTL